MLHPSDRNLYTDALTPPRGYVFDQAIGTTYTLDPTTLLTIPVYLGLTMRRKGGEADPVDLLGALHRVADRITVYAQYGRIQVPDGEQILFSLLEPMIVEAASPGGGAFHPKVWVLRFKDSEGGGPIFRLLVLSRNLTADRSWDLCLQLEGQLTKKAQAANQPLYEFVRSLPSLAINTVAARKRKQAKEFSAEIACVKWELPEGFDEVRFHVIQGKSWLPMKSDRLAVVSPFVTIPALKALAGTTKKAEALVSRPEELDGLERDLGEMFERVEILNDAVESDDGEDMSGHDMYGLHAKAIVTEKGDKVRVYVGSANATTSALVGGHNVEFFAELAGSRTGGIDALLGEDGIGEYIVPWTSDGKSEVDPKKEEGEKIRDRVREALTAAKFRVGCVEDTRSGKWQLNLSGNTAIDLQGVKALRAWPITVRDTHAVNMLGSMSRGIVNLGAYSLQSVTGLIAFEVVSDPDGMETRFTLNLPLDDPPEGRHAAILRAALKNREGFLRYLLLLLGEFDGGLGQNIDGIGSGAGGQWSDKGEDVLPLLEEMTRAFSRDPTRLHEIRGAVERLESETDSDNFIPEEFRALWATFDKALGRG
ncbi:MAG: phospholipase D family protein [Gammaproteobacteria bacterium]|nr:phospholipase D family protein [Gammaproteobacteria bacterium]